MEKHEILKVVVGSQAHGLARPDSDYDYRAVYIVPTREILSLGANVKATTWVEGAEDNTAYELGHFLHLALKCNPSILEVFVAPSADAEMPGKGSALREMFPYVWNSVDVRNAFLGYAHNQRKKFMEEKDGRPWKFAVAYLRVLILGADLLRTGAMSLAVSDEYKERLMAVRDGKWSKGAVIDLCETLTAQLNEAFEANRSKEADPRVVNEYLLAMRRAYWEIA